MVKQLSTHVDIVGIGLKHAETETSSPINTCSHDLSTASTYGRPKVRSQITNFSLALPLCFHAPRFRTNSIEQNLSTLYDEWVSSSTSTSLFLIRTHVKLFQFTPSDIARKEGIALEYCRSYFGWRKTRQLWLGIMHSKIFENLKKLVSGFLQW